MEKDSLIYVAGHRGLVGSAICRNLRQQGFDRLLLRSRAELDLTDAVAVRQLLRAGASRSTSFSPQPKSAEFLPTICIRRTLSAKT